MDLIVGAGTLLDTTAADTTEAGMMRTVVPVDMEATTVIVAVAMEAAGAQGHMEVAAVMDAAAAVDGVCACACVRACVRTRDGQWRARRRRSKMLLECSLCASSVFERAPS